jgi:hypothetical protein
MGSGKLIRAAHEKYHIDSFAKDVLFIFDNEDEMNAKEAELVTDDFVKLTSNYNLCPGGKGGWGYLNDSSETHRERSKRAGSSGGLALKGTKRSRSAVEKTAAANRQLYAEEKFQTPGFSGKTHSEEWRKNRSALMKIKQAGEKNSQFDTMWITNGAENRKVKKDVDNIPEGWYKGRINKQKLPR